MAKELLTVMPCPKCGHDAPVLTQTYTEHSGYSGEETNYRCIVWHEGRDEYTTDSTCSCQRRKVSFWTGRTKFYYDKKCKQCKGTGELEPKKVPAIPDMLLVTCPACLHKREIKPLDAKKSD